MAFTGLAIGGIGSLAKMVTGAVQASKAKKALQNFQRQQLVNAYKGIGVSRLGADLAAEQSNLAAATSIEALQQMGTRGIAGIGNVQANLNNVMNKQYANLDQQRNNIDKLVAQDDVRIQKMQEKRDNLDLQGLGNLMNVGQQNLFSGVGDAAQTVMSGMNINEAEGNQYGGFTPQVSQVNSGMGSKGFSSMVNTGFSALPNYNPSPQIGASTLPAQNFAPNMPQGWMGNNPFN